MMKNKIKKKISSHRAGGTIHVVEHIKVIYRVYRDDQSYNGTYPLLQVWYLHVEDAHLEKAGAAHEHDEGGDGQADGRDERFAGVPKEQKKLRK